MLYIHCTGCQGASYFLVLRTQNSALDEWACMLGLCQLLLFLQHYIFSDSSRKAIIDLMVSKGYTRFYHRDDINEFTNTPKNDLFVRNDIVKLRMVEQYD